MYKRFLISLAVTASLLVYAVPASAVLIWDVIPDDGSAITDGSGSWYDDFGFFSWNNGTGNVEWDNDNPDIAQFGVEASSDAYTVNVVGTIKTLGLVNYKQYDILPDPFSGGDIELKGTSPLITCYASSFYIECNLTTAAEVETVNMRAGSLTETGYFYLYGANTFDAPLVIGSDPEVALGTYAMQYNDDAFGGSSAAGITVMHGSSLGCRGVNFVTAKPITIAGGGRGGRGAINFYKVSSEFGGGPATRDLQGPVTLSGDATIEMREDVPHSNTISGAISGAYTLTLQNNASNMPGRIRLTNPANSTTNLVVNSDAGGGAAPVFVTLDATYTATESIAVGPDSTLIVSGATYLATPLITLDQGSATLDASAAGLTVASGQTLQGIGTVIGNVTVGAGGNIAPGKSAGILIAGAGGSVDLSAGGNMTWELAELKDNEDGEPGVAYDFLVIPGDLILGEMSQLTLDFTAVGDPVASEPFWTSSHTWKIIDVGATTTDDFGEIVNDSFAAGDFTTSVDVGNDVSLTFTPGAAPQIPGDANNDGSVNDADARRLAENWGATAQSPSYDTWWEMGDFDGDEFVGPADAAIMAANWGYTSPEGAEGVPEPGSLLLLASVLAFVAIRRWR